MADSPSVLSPSSHLSLPFDLPFLFKHLSFSSIRVYLLSSRSFVFSPELAGSRQGQTGGEGFRMLVFVSCRSILSYYPLAFFFLQSRLSSTFLFLFFSSEIPFLSYVAESLYESRVFRAGIWLDI